MIILFFFVFFILSLLDDVKRINALRRHPPPGRAQCRSKCTVPFGDYIIENHRFTGKNRRDKERNKKKGWEN